MGKNIQQLHAIASVAFTDAPPELASIAGLNAELRQQFEELLTDRNGFYAFESALHVFPGTPVTGIFDLASWNDDKGWIASYQQMADNMFFFAEDIFGCQFCFHNNQVCSFNSETAELTPIAADLEEWAGVILADASVLTGYPLAHEWQAKQGALPPGQRLVPKLPFVLGGPFTPENLYSLDVVKAMLFYAGLATQLRDLPDRTQIQLKIID